MRDPRKGGEKVPSEDQKRRVRLQREGAAGEEEREWMNRRVFDRVAAMPAELLRRSIRAYLAQL
jgi:hypothetical protein